MTSFRKSMQKYQNLRLFNEFYTDYHIKEPIIWFNQDFS